MKGVYDVGQKGGEKGGKREKKIRFFFCIVVKLQGLDCFRYAGMPIVHTLT